MILTLEYPNGRRKNWRIYDYTDLKAVYTAFPQAKAAALSADTLEQAVEAIAEYLSNHALEAWVENGEEPMTKNIRAVGAALGIALGALTPIKIGDQNRAQAVRQSDNFGTHPTDRFLWNIKQTESSGGKNTNHPVVRYGLSRGDRAIGRWGLLHNTIKEMNGRLRRVGQLSPERDKLDTMSRDKVEEEFKKNPQLELDIARQLAQHVLKRNNGDHHRAAYSWLHGHNLHPSQVPDHAVLASDYVDKFKSNDRRNPFLMSKPEVAQKSEPVGDFVGRFRNWYKRRLDHEREPKFWDSNYNPDPGRLREKELDEKPVKDKSQEVPYLKQKIKDAKNGRQT